MFESVFLSPASLRSNTKAYPLPFCLVEIRNFLKIAHIPPTINSIQKIQQNQQIFVIKVGPDEKTTKSLRSFLM